MVKVPGEALIPRLSKDEIEDIAEEVIARHSKITLSRPTRTPLLEYVEQACQEEGLIFNASCYLGSAKDGRKILGAFRQEPLAILVDASLANEETRFRFTVAHEFGHFTLHRDLAISDDIGLSRTIQDTALEVDQGHRDLATARDWVEWQANCFASALLIPRATIHHAVRDVQGKLGIVNNLGRIILEARSYSYADLNRQLLELGFMYLVSKTAMQYRLESLGIIVDRRNKDTAAISRILRGY